MEYTVIGLLFWYRAQILNQVPPKQFCVCFWYFTKFRQFRQGGFREGELIVFCIRWWEICHGAVVLYIFRLDIYSSSELWHPFRQFLMKILFLCLFRLFPIPEVNLDQNPYRTFPPPNRRIEVLQPPFSLSLSLSLSLFRTVKAQLLTTFPGRKNILSHTSLSLSLSAPFSQKQVSRPEGLVWVSKEP